MPTRLAINGFGRIGRAAFKIASEKKDIEIVAINDLTNANALAHLLKYDSVYGIFSKEVHVEQSGKKLKLDTWDNVDEFFKGDTAPDTYLVVDGKKTLILSEKDPANLPWKSLEIDVVLECTGRFVKDGAATAHVEAGAKKVVVSAPTKGSGNIQMFLLGANHDQYFGQNVISNASCTTNCISPVMRVLHKNFKVLKSAMTTIHAYTSTQNLVDGPAPGGKGDMRRARGAAQNIIPTTTGAAIATTKVIPDLEGVFDGLAIRVPVPTGSITDITVLLNKKTSKDEINNAFVEASKQDFYKGILGVSYEPLVSTDIVGSSYSAIVDLALTNVVDGDLVKVMAWYDNEWGYSTRLVEMALLTTE
ncbi:MAG: type I glyceraldehyde-3-phosphate dehydrogenase [Patescibacteria group bacterium]